MQPEAQRGGVACASGEDGEHGLRRLVDSSTMDVKYPVVWKERTELWISVWISMIFHDIPKKWQPVGATNFYFPKHGRTIQLLGSTP